MKKLMPLILILVSVGVFFFFIDPLYKETKVIDNQIKANDETLKKFSELRLARNQLEEKYKNIGKEQIKELEEALPDTIDNVRLILYLDDTAKSKGVPINGISISGSSLDGGEKKESTKNSSESLYGKISASFSVVSSYEDIKNFLARLEESKRILEIKDLSISAGQGQFYNYTVKLDTYWLR
jgi:Tfp pilus assembly protein PilO